MVQLVEHRVDHIQRFPRLVDRILRAGLQLLQKLSPVLLRAVFTYGSTNVCY
jgi:hypothetical protein